ncbi:MAG: hypothetical protein ACT4O1_05090 [Gemmatimonadota bacterium]
MGVMITRHSSIAGTSDFEATGAYPFGIVTAALDYRRRGWENLGEDLGVADLNASEQQATFGLSSGWKNRASLGVRAQRLMSTYVGSSARQWAFDVGAQWQVRNHTRLGIALNDAGASDPNGIGTLPTALSIGIENRFAAGQITTSTIADVSRRIRDEDLSYRIGIDLSTKSRDLDVHARVGLARGEEGLIPSLGGEIGVANFHLALAYSARDLGNELMISVALSR